MIYAVACGVAALLLAAGAFLFYGNVLIWKFRVIKRLEAAQAILAPIALKRAIQKGQHLRVIGSMQLASLAEIQNGSQASEFEHRTLGDTLQIVQFRRQTLRKIVSELRLYSALLLVAGILAFLVMIGKVNFDIGALLSRIGDEPFQILAAFELLMLGIFCVRLFIELQIIDDILEE